MKKKTKGGAVFAVLAMVAGLTSACGTQPSDSNLEQVNLVVASAPGPITPFLWAGLHEGIFEKHGIDLQIKNVDGASAMVSAILSGQMDAGISAPEPGIIARAQDGAPLVSTMQTAYKGVFKWGYLKGESVKSATDIKDGTRIGVPFPTGLSVVSLQLELERHGIAYDKVKVVPIGNGPSMVAAIEKGEVDVLWHADVGYALLEHQKVPVTIEDPVWDDEWVSQVMMSTTDKVKSRATALTALNAAMAESIKWCVDDKEGCIDALAEQVPEAVTNRDQALAIWAERSKIHVAPEGETFGTNLTTDWNNTIDGLKSGGMITEAKDISSFFTNELGAK